MEDITISQQCARITRVDEIYFVEDLSSSNGTMVDGEVLSYKTKISLKKDKLFILQISRIVFYEFSVFGN